MYSMIEENKFLNALKTDSNYGYTENGAIKHISTMSSILDMFAMGASMRSRSDEDIILCFKKAYEEDMIYALKCLMYIRNIRGGQGERRFFKLCITWLAKNYPEVAQKIMPYIPLFGRWDDLYAFVHTPLQRSMFNFLKSQYNYDIKANIEDMSLLGKWLKSENTSSQESRKLGRMTRIAFGISPKEYRVSLSDLRRKLNVLERTLSQGDWDKIEFDKLPSKAGLKYSHAFATNEVTKERYAAFMENKKTKVNAGTLYPYEIVEKALQSSTPTDIAVANKYWDNLTDYFNGMNFNGIAVVDTSGSMYGVPLNVAISLGIYCAERANGPFKDHYITFSSKPNLVKVEGIDFVHKVINIYKNCIIEDTNIEAVFDLLLKTAIKHKCSQRDLPQNIIIISDMEFNRCNVSRYKSNKTLFAVIEDKWKKSGYKMPHLIFWNVNARTNNIPMISDNTPISYVSGFSPVIFKSILSGKTGCELMMETLNNNEYSFIDREFGKA